MLVEYKEIDDPSYIDECVDVHKRIFNLANEDAFPAAFFQLVIRKEHPLGYIVGCFRETENKKELIGLSVLTADMPDNSVYCLFVGVLPEYLGTRYAYNLVKKVVEITADRGLKTLYAIYDPLEANVGKIYAHSGGLSTKYITPSMQTGSILSSPDKVLYELKISSGWKPSEILGRIADVFTNCPIATNLNCDADKLLIEIPNNFIELKSQHLEQAQQWRQRTRELFSEYINNRDYVISNVVSGRINSEKKTFYILEKLQ